MGRVMDSKCDRWRGLITEEFAKESIMRLNGPPLPLFDNRGKNPYTVRLEVAPGIF